MRYSFHGKVRATGQQVDGYVEAETSTEAIDRLADQGIIGVYSVRAEPKQPRNAVLLAGTPEFERAQFEDPATTAARKSRRALPAPPVAQPAPMPAPLPLPAPVAEAVPAAPPTSGVTDATMLALVDKLSQLIVKVQQVLDRPAQVVYASGGGSAREGKGGGGKGTRRPVNDAQNSTLRDIFQNNLDLRRSLQKLADTVTPAPAATNGSAAAPEASAPVVEAAAPEAPGSFDDEPTPPPHGGATTAVAEAPDATPAPSFDAHGDEGDDMPLRVHDADHARQAQPAA